VADAGKRRAAATALVAVVVAAAGWLAFRPHGVASQDPASNGAATNAAKAGTGPNAHQAHQADQAHGNDPPNGLPAAESGLLPWHLSEPLSREVVTAGPHGHLLVLGGLTSGSASANAVYAVNTATGTASQVGTLRTPLHDAAAAVSGRRALVFGGGSPATVAIVQSFPLVGGHATKVTSLPAPRSDAGAATIGDTTYIVGGYDGSRPDAQVLATKDGHSYATIATLPVPVRYAAVAALGGRIYAFGGQAITGPHAGSPVNVIQVIDPTQHTATVVGNLPVPLAGAMAVTVDGELFVAGGESPAAGRPTPGLGTTQLTGQPTATTASGTEGPASPTRTESAIWAYDPAKKRLLPAGRLQVPVSHAAIAAIAATAVTGTHGSDAWIVGGESNGTIVSSVQLIRPDRAFGTAGAPGAGSPYFGDKLLIADRGNNRLRVLDAAMHVTWTYPSAGKPKDPLGFYFPDDAFFTNHGTAIISNQEQNDTIVKLAYPSGKIVWSYGHPGQSGTARGYLHEPDDAYLLKNGQVTVADPMNCRVLVINENHTVARQIGTDGECYHNPPASMGSPNGDTPLTDGNLLISEINGSWVSEYTRSGKLMWTVHLAVVGYPSDPQQVGPDRYLLADYSEPGQFVEFDRKGKILYRYGPTSGPGMLNHPSLAELLPSGVIMANDDYNDRMVAIDPATGALVWQYGITGKPGTGTGQLNIPDGFDLLQPDGSTPTHPGTG
jgi:outer membrane protein assembly factor BamB